MYIYISSTSSSSHSAQSYLITQYLQSQKCQIHISVINFSDKQTMAQYFMICGHFT